MKTGVKVFLSVVLALVVIVSGFVSYVLWDNRDIPIARTPVAAEEVLAPFELKREVYGDPEIFDQPRIQFSWQGPNREKPEIWSVKVDGTDLRLAVDADLLYPNGVDLGMQPGFNTYRSPDNRYILVMLAKYRVRYPAIHIIDLKERTNTKIKSTDTTYLIRYPWVSDSKSFFYLRTIDDSLSRYYLEDKKIETIKKTYSKSFYVQQTEEIINQIGSEDLIRLDFKGDELEIIPLGNNVHREFHYINPNGTNYIFKNYKGTYFVFMNNIKSAEKLSSKGSPMILSGSDSIIFSGYNISSYSLKNKTENIIYEKYDDTKPNANMRNYSIFNERINNDK